MKDPKQRAGVSRRAFLQGSSAAAAATALAGGPGLVSAQEAGPEVARGKQDITLNINGKEHKVQVEPRMTLLEVLRFQLGLTGAKPVSPAGDVGAATVIIDDKPAAADTTLALSCRGKKIQTVESLGGKEPDAVVKAFVKHDAEQCGFCTPGFVVAVRAFLSKNPRATEAEIRSGLNGNLCRCGTYANVIQAALAVVKGGS
jgi:xanthine dehydrogenase YagT iron-sulfur-binding subunit